MTPKEKARKLVIKFGNIDSDSEMFDGFKMPLFYAQRCSLIAVDEIINALEYLDDDSEYFWEKVKKEINKL